MKKILYAAVLTAGVLNAEQEEIKLSGLYLGAGVNVNQDMAKIYTRVNYPNVAEGTKFLGMNDFSYGVHGLVGYNQVFSNRISLGIEQQVGVATLSDSKMKSYTDGKKYEDESRILKPWEFTTLARLGYAFESFPGILYVSGGIKVLRTYNEDGGKSIIRPVVGVGYQHAFLTHWGLRGDVTYTHVSSVNFRFKAGNECIDCKGKGHRVSAAISLVYTF